MSGMVGYGRIVPASRLIGQNSLQGMCTEGATHYAKGAEQSSQDNHPTTDHLYFTPVHQSHGMLPV